MKKITFSLQSVPLGSVVLAEGRLSLRESTNEKLRILLQQTVRVGVPVRRSVRFKEGRALLKKRVFPDDPGFLFALKDFIRKQGFEIYDETLSLNQQVLELVQCLGAGHPLVKGITEQLPGMSVLEKTYLIDEMIKRFEEAVTTAHQEKER